METAVKLSEAEESALAYLKANGGGVLTTSVPDKNERGVFGEIEAGMSTYKKLERKGLVYFTEEDPVEDPGGPLDGFVFTNEIYISEAGEEALANVAK